MDYPDRPTPLTVDRGPGTPSKIYAWWMPNGDVISPLEYHLIKHMKFFTGLMFVITALFIVAAIVNLIEALQ